MFQPINLNESGSNGISVKYRYEWKADAHNSAF